MSNSILMIRHAPTAWNQDKRLQGRTDEPLSAPGKQQAKGWQLPDGWADADRFSSPLARCLQTSELMGLTAQKEPALIETSWGEWEGQRIADIRAADPEGLAQRESAGLDFFPPGGESARDVQKRLMPFLASRATAKRRTIAMTHNGVIRAVYALAVAWDMTGPPPDTLENSCAHLFSLAENGFPAVDTLNIPLGPS